MNNPNRTPAQQEAVMTTEEEVLLLAGPGSGKTATIVARIVKLLEDGTDPARIVILTFTNAAARELEERLHAAFRAIAMEQATEFWVLGYVGTLHGFALKMLKEHGGFMGYGERISVISPESAAALLASNARTLGSKSPMKRLLEVKRTAPGTRATRRNVDEIVVDLYLDELRTAGIVDYDLILSEFDRMMGESGAGYGTMGMLYDYLFVDEVQDSAEADWSIYINLGMRWKFFVGDPDQSIYGFRGAALQKMLDYGNALGTHVIRLEENFRSWHQICEAANRLIRNNVNRIPKETRSATCGNLGRVESLGLLLTEGEELAVVARNINLIRADGVKSPSIAILARTNHLAGVFRTTLAAGGVIPVLVREVSELPRDWPFARSTVELLASPDNDTLAYFNIIAAEISRGNVSPKAAEAFAHSVRTTAAAKGTSINSANMNYPRVKTANDAAIALADLGVSFESRMIIGDRLKQLPRDASVLDLALAMATVRDVVEEEVDVDDGKNPVEVLTLHGAKGREFDVVFLVGMEDETIPGKRRDVDVEEERRLLFVGLTRARVAVYISGAAQRITAWGAFENHTPTRFAKEIFG